MSAAPRLWMADAGWDAIHAEAERVFPYETGGVLLGYMSGSLTTSAPSPPPAPLVASIDVVVEFVIGPGPDATHSATAFEPDHAFHEHAVASAYDASGRRTVYLGDWHSHPRGSAYLSRTDLRTLEHIARAPDARLPEPVMLVLAGPPWFARAWIGHLEQRSWSRRLRVREMQLLRY